MGLNWKEQKTMSLSSLRRQWQSSTTAKGDSSFHIRYFINSVIPSLGSTHCCNILAGLTISQKKNKLTSRLKLFHITPLFINSTH